MRKNEYRRGPSPDEKRRSESRRRSAKQQELAEIRKRQATRAATGGPQEDSFEPEEEEECAYAPGSTTGSQGEDLMAAKLRSQSRQGSPVREVTTMAQSPGKELPAAALLRDELESALLEFGGDLSSLPTVKVRSRSSSPVRQEDEELPTVAKVTML